MTDPIEDLPLAFIKADRGRDILNDADELICITDRRSQKRLTLEFRHVDVCLMLPCLVETGSIKRVKILIRSGRVNEFGASLLPFEICKTSEITSVMVEKD